LSKGSGFTFLFTRKDAMKVASIVLFFCVTALIALGMVMLISASTGLSVTPKYLLLQPIWCILGFLACWVASMGDYRWCKKHSWLVWGLLTVTCGLLVLVLVPGIGHKIKGASRWLKLGSLTLQPSELAKISLILALAWYGERFQRQMGTFLKGIVVPGLFIGLVLGLVFLEPDVGTFLLMATVTSAMLLVAGIRLRYFLPPVFLGMIAIGLFLYNNPMRSERIYTWLHVEETKQEKGMQAYQAMVALGSGGVYGVGLGDGRQKHGFVPEHQTDFIYSVIGEELGLIATLGVVLAFLAIVICACISPGMPGHIRNVARLRDYLSDRTASHYQYWSGHRFVAEQGLVSAVHQLRRIEPRRHARLHRPPDERGAPRRQWRKILPSV